MQMDRQTQREKLENAVMQGDEEGERYGKKRKGSVSRRGEVR